MQYAIGLTYPPTPFNQYSPPIPWPQKSNPEPYAVSFDRGDGTVAGHGFPYTKMLFQFLEQTELNHLLGLLTVSGVLMKSRAGIYIQVPSPENQIVFAVYTSIMVLPDNLADYRQPGNLYVNVPFEFRHLQAYP